MANAQILVLVRSSAPLAPDQVRAPIEAAARARGFTPGAWTFNTQTVQVTPGPEGGVVSGGPWAGEIVSETVPSAGLRLVFNAYRQNLLNGPDPSPAVAYWPIDTAPISALLRALPGVSSTRLAFRAPNNSISWDRGIPDPISLVAASSSGPSNALWGLLAIGALAWGASAYSRKQPTLARGGLSGFGKLSTNREGLTFEEWRRAAGVPSGTRGIHAAWARSEDPTEWRTLIKASGARLMGARR